MDRLVELLTNELEGHQEAPLCLAYLLEYILLLFICISVSYRLEQRKATLWTSIIADRGPDEPSQTIGELTVKSQPLSGMTKPSRTHSGALGITYGCLVVADGVINGLITIAIRILVSWNL